MLDPMEIDTVGGDPRAPRVRLGAITTWSWEGPSLLMSDKAGEW